MTVTVTVTDVNDNPPALEKLEFTATVPEDALTNTVVTKIRAVDPDLGEETSLCPEGELLLNLYE